MAEDAVDVASAEDDAVVAVALLEPPVAFAAAWNVASWPSPGLIANTIPAAQCDVGTCCLQYIQTGSVSPMIRLAAGKGPAVFSAPTGWKPESKPPSRGVHGLAKLD